ncbi:MAG: DUF3987 domain-containing protein [Desulforegulaceae bacterium]|nr:DUF3987 domain-containing protein [Desulforegulaceae bacterium]
MSEKTKADTRPAYSNNINNTSNIIKKQDVITFDKNKIIDTIRRLLKEKLDIDVDAVEIGTADFVRPKQKSSIFYKIFDNGDGNFVLFAGDFATGEQFSECLNGSGKYRTMTEADRKLIQEAKKTRDAEREKQAEEDAKKAVYILKNSNNAIPEDFGYCLKKGLTGSDFKAFQLIGYNHKYKNIVMPLFDINGKHWSNQYIYAEKITLPNGKKTDKRNKGKTNSCFNVAGDIAKSETIYIAEGAATADTVHLATDKPCVFCVNAGNIEPVYLALKGKYSDKEVVLIADNDIEKEAEKGINKGRETAEELNNKYGLPYVLCPVNSDFNDYYKGFIDEGGTREQALSKVKEYILNPDNIIEANQKKDEEETKQITDITTAQQDYPLRSYPFHCLPTDLVQSFEQLAKSLNSSSRQIPGIAMAIISGITGSSIQVHVKEGYTMPLTLFCCDIRHKGQGKSPLINKLLKTIKEKQKAEEKKYINELAEYQKAKTRGDDDIEKPEQTPALSVDDFTMESLRENPSYSGGLICLVHELAGIFNGANQYKGGKGSDKETILNLKDGQTITIKRKGLQVTLPLAVSISGGMQPPIFKRLFNGNSYTENGTVERFIYTYEQYKTYLETGDIWTQEHQQAWLKRLNNLLLWYETLKSNQSICFLKLTPEAFELYKEYRNNLVLKAKRYPEIIKGYINKITGDCSRIAGLLHLFDCLNSSHRISGEITAETYNKAIEIADFYLAEFINIMAVLILEKKQSLDLADKELSNLAQTLSKILDHANEDNYLKFNDIREAYNKDHAVNIKPRSKKIGLLIEKAGLNKTNGQVHLKNNSGDWTEKATCLICDDELKRFLNYYIKDHIQHIHDIQNTVNTDTQHGYDKKSSYPTYPEKTEDKQAMVMMDMTQKDHIHSENTINKSFGYDGYDGYDVVSKNKPDQQTKPVEQKQTSFEIFKNGDVAVLND